MLEKLEQIVHHKRQGANFDTSPAVQTRLMEQYTDFLDHLAQVQPLLLILDDLQWTDAASANLLFHLGRRIGTAPILLVGAYRSDEVALGRDGERHPLDKVLVEFKRYYGDIEVDLTQTMAAEGRQFVGALLGIHPNRLSMEFRQALFEHTEGHPLFTVELLQAMQERGDLVRDAQGRWIEGPGLDWQALPTRVEAVIEERLSRLEAEEHELVAVASVEEEEFTAEVVAQVQGKVIRAVLRALSELEKRHRLVRAQGEVSVAGRYLSRYRFTHALFQQYVYNELSPGERRLLHGEIADALETLYGERSIEIAIRLARHYAEAGIEEKAVMYQMQAGDQAHQLSANQEALRFYQQALALAKHEETYNTILSRRARVLLDLYRGKEAVSDYERLLNLAQQLGDREQELESLLGLARACYLVALDDQETDSALRLRELCTMAQSLASELSNKRSRISSLLLVRKFLDFWPEYRDQVAAQVQEALALSQELGDEELILESKLALLSIASSRERVELGEALLEDLQIRRDLVRLNEVYFRLMWANYHVGNFARAVACCDAGIELAGRIGVPPVMYPTLKALALLGLGRYGCAWEALQQEIADDAHPFGRTFKEMGIGMYFLEVTAYTRAATVFEQVMEQAARLRRGWLRAWARLMRVRSLIRAGRVGQIEWLRAAQALADMDRNVLKRFYTAALETPLLEMQAEMALAEGRPGDALKQITDVSAKVEAIGYKPRLVSAWELQARVFLQLQRPAEALSLSETALQMATEMEYLPMVWRLSATRAQAREALEQAEAADKAWQAAAALIERLAGTISQDELQQGFLSDPLAAFILARARHHHDCEEER
jgi:tetratricopeptide (TPR) repeat protein